jgi:hypothetical protein
VKLTAAELLELNLEEQIESSYSVSASVVGLADVDAGYRPLYPVTVYQISGDDTSGIAGMLFPDGRFLEASEQRKTARFWEFDETLRYEPVLDAEGKRIPVLGPYGKTYLLVKGDSWTEGEVVWDGSSGPIMPLVEMDTEVEVAASQKANGKMFVRRLTLVKATVVVHRRLEDTNSLLGDSEALNRPERKTDRKPGKIHFSNDGDDRAGYFGDKAA